MHPGNVLNCFYTKLTIILYYIINFWASCNNLFISIMNNVLWNSVKINLQCLVKYYTIINIEFQKYFCDITLSYYSNMHLGCVIKKNKKKKY